MQGHQHIHYIRPTCRPQRRLQHRSHPRRSRKGLHRRVLPRHRPTKGKAHHSKRMPRTQWHNLLQGRRLPHWRARSSNARGAERPRLRQLQMQKRRPRSAILENEDGHRAEIDTSRPPPLSVLFEIVRVFAHTPFPLPSFCCSLASPHAFGNSNISSCNVRSYMYFTDTFPSLSLSLLRLRSCAPGFAVCLIASYLSTTLYVSYISPGAWCATKLL